MNKHSTWPVWNKNTNYPKKKSVDYKFSDLNCAQLEFLTAFIVY
jgi:hypothetical protein